MTNLETYFFRITILLYMNMITVQVLASQGLGDLSISVSKASPWIITVFCILHFVDKWVDSRSEETKEVE